MNRWLGRSAWLLVAVAGLVPWQVQARISGPTEAVTQAAAIRPVGDPIPGSVLEDTEFGVRTDQFGLDRRVEMFQWFRDPDGRYERVWKPVLVDSSDFTAGHRNPAELPLQGQRWWAVDASLDGKPIDLSVLKTLGEWEDFRPGFSRLRANLAATFQPEGNGLASSDNPLDPRVGDLRIHWRQLRLPVLAGQVELEDGRWQLAARPGLDARLSRESLTVTGNQEQTATASRWFWILGAGFVLAFVLLLLRARRKR